MWTSVCKILNDKLCLLFFILKRILGTWNTSGVALWSLIVVMRMSRVYLSGTDADYHIFRLKIFTMMRNLTRQLQNWKLVLHKGPTKQDGWHHVTLTSRLTFRLMPPDIWDWIFVFISVTLYEMCQYYLSLN